jgi:hypothetical protein
MGVQCQDDTEQNDMGQCQTGKFFRPESLNSSKSRVCSLSEEGLKGCIKTLLVKILEFSVCEYDILLSTF